MPIPGISIPQPLPPNSYHANKPWTKRFVDTVVIVSMLGMFSPFLVWFLYHLFTHKGASKLYRASREKDRQQDRQQYIRTWHGWVEISKQDLRQQRWDAFKAFIAHNLRWRTTTAKYDWIFWDPDGTGYKEYKRRREETFIGQLPRWMRSYKHGALNPASRFPNHCLVDLEQGRIKSGIAPLPERRPDPSSYMTGALPTDHHSSTIRRRHFSSGNPDMWRAGSEEMERATKTQLLIPKEAPEQPNSHGVILDPSTVRTVTQSHLNLASCQEETSDPHPSTGPATSTIASLPKIPNPRAFSMSYLAGQDPHTSQDTVSYRSRRPSVDRRSLSTRRIKKNRASISLDHPASPIIQQLIQEDKQHYPSSPKPLKEDLKTNLIRVTPTPSLASKCCDTVGGMASPSVSLTPQSLHVSDSQYDLNNYEAQSSLDEAISVRSISSLTSQIDLADNTSSRLHWYDHPSSTWTDRWKSPSSIQLARIDSHGRHSPFISSTAKLSLTSTNTLLLRKRRRPIDRAIPAPPSPETQTVILTTQPLPAPLSMPKTPPPESPNPDPTFLPTLQSHLTWLAHELSPGFRGPRSGHYDVWHHGSRPLYSPGPSMDANSRITQREIRRLREVVLGPRRAISNPVTGGTVSPTTLEHIHDWRAAVNALRRVSGEGLVRERLEGVLPSWGFGEPDESAVDSAAWILRRGCGGLGVEGEGERLFGDAHGRVRSLREWNEGVGGRRSRGLFEARGAGMMKARRMVGLEGFEEGGGAELVVADRGCGMGSVRSDENASPRSVLSGQGKERRGNEEGTGCEVEGTAFERSSRFWRNLLR